MDQKIILVTGGNRGIGLGICRQLAKLGHKVIMGARDLDDGKNAAENLEGDVYPQQLDVTKEADIKNLTGQIKDKFGKLDVLINNAGILVGEKGPSNVNIEEVKSIMEVNFYAPWRLIQAMLPLLENSAEGRIINMSSSMGEWASLSAGDYAGYRTSKTALNALTVQLAAELFSTGLKVNAMSPGWVRTDMGGAGADRSIDEGADTATWLATAEHIPTGKFFRDRKEIPW
jgi:NAD(P)-dependent dehydrogenase (short-subunit alcohol dehydrogenase family)